MTAIQPHNATPPDAEQQLLLKLSFVHSEQASQTIELFGFLLMHKHGHDFTYQFLIRAFRLCVVQYEGDKGIIQGFDQKTF